MSFVVAVPEMVTSATGALAVADRVFHEQFARTLAGGANSYTTAEAASASPPTEPLGY